MFGAGYSCTECDIQVENVAKPTAEKPTAARSSTFL
jgi:hypothetical protein